MFEIIPGKKLGPPLLAGGRAVAGSPAGRRAQGRALWPPEAIYHRLSTWIPPDPVFPTPCLCRKRRNSSTRHPGDRIP